NFIDSITVMSGAGCVTSFTATFPNTSVRGPFITATATRSGSSTSEFAKCVQAPIPALGVSYFKMDFDMDNKTEIGFYRSGLWGFLKSSFNYNTNNSIFFSWGGAGLQPIVGDFDGDGKADIGYIVPPSGGQSATYAILLSSRN